MGVAIGDRVAMMMSNRPEHWLADLAVIQAGGIPTTFYPTLSPDQVRSQATHVGVTTVILQNAGQIQHLSHSLASAGVRRRVVLDGNSSHDEDDPNTQSYNRILERGRVALEQDPGILERSTRRRSAGDLATIIFTSGTTAEPKAVPLTHGNVIAAASGLLDAADLPMPYRSVSYLPTAHILDRLCNIYITVMRGGDISFSPTPDSLPRVVAHARPTSFVGVPRTWEKFLSTLKNAPEGHDVEALGVIGLQDVVLATTAGAPISGQVAEGLRARGLPLVDIWGLTEVAGAITATSSAGARPHSVGRAVSHAELKIAPDGEVLVRGPQVAPGYLREDGSLDAIVDADGWFATGDLGSRDPDGYLYLTDRKKEVIVTSGGKNVSPVALESLLLQSPLISQAAVFGNRRPYIVALLVLDFDYLRTRIESASTDVDQPGADRHRLVHDPEIEAEVARTIGAVNGQLARSEGIKRWHLLAEQWTTSDGTLTPTQKMRRGVIEERYQDVLERLYTDGRPARSENI
jgi:long-chain acyl-CoA synthetase